MSSPRLIGRTEEWAALDAAFERAHDGDPTLVLVIGEAGVGKSRLVAEFVAEAGLREPEPLVLGGTCAPMGDVGAPYGPILAALRTLARRSEGRDLGVSTRPGADQRAFERELGLAGGLLATTATAVAQAGDPVDGVRLFEALLDLFQRLGRGRTVILVIEDLQWADQSTREILDFLVRCLRDARILVVATVRTDEVGRRHALVPYLAELLRNRHVVRLEVAALGSADVRELIETIDGAAPSAERLDRIESLADGNPFYVEELAAAIGDAGTIPASVREIVLGRVATLSDAARNVIRVAAVAGRSVDHGTLAAIAELDDRALGRAMDETIERGLIAYDSDREAYRFRHGLVREAVYADLLPGDRRRLHAAVARALADGRGGPPSRLAAEIADHYDRAGRVASALEASIAAAEAAERVHGFHEATRHYERALELEAAAGSVSIGHDALTERAAEAAYGAGVPDRAVELVRGLLAGRDPGSDPSRVADLHGRLAAYLRDTGDETAAIAASRAAVALLAAVPDATVRARVFAAHGRMLMLLSQSTEAEAVCAEAVEAARLAGSAVDEASALVSLGVAVAGLGRTDEGLAILDRGLAVAQAAGEAQETARAHLNIDYVNWMAGRLEAALDASTRGIEALRRLGLEWIWGSRLLASAGEKLFELGRWDEAGLLMDQAADRHLAGMAGFALSLDRAQLAMNRGELAAAEAHLEHARELGVRVIGTGTVTRWWLIIAQLAIWRGRPDDARAAIAEGLARVEEEDRAATVATLVGVGLRSDADSAELARDRRDPERLIGITADGDRLLAEAESEAARAEPRAAPGVREHPALAAFLALAHAEHARLHRAPAASLWADAADRFDGLGMVHRVGYARYRLAEALLSAGARRSDAAAALSEAQRIAAELRAIPLLTEIEGLATRSRLTLDGSRPGAPTVPTSPASDLYGLTPRELEVLGHLAAGRTNRQIAEALFITEKTAGLHVSNILGKLEVTNRGEAAAVAHRLGIAGPTV